MPYEYMRGDVVPSSFDAGIVAASYFASLCGATLTIELLNRRATALRNLRSWLETLSCATAMGVVGIWCMHFIGNRAIILGDGQDNIQLSYNAGYTTLSVFCPILGLIAAFSAAEWPTRSRFRHWAALLVTGLLAGGSIAAMHYVGNFGVKNYTLSYTPRFLAASIVIAVGDCMIVLLLFYTLREKWISSWWKRLLCAIGLAGGVTAMHFTASTQCTYIFIRYNTPSEITSRNVQVIVAGSICGAALTVLCFLFLMRSREKALRQRSQMITLACVTFDPAGRILVTTEGYLPSQEITDKYNHRTFDEDFNVSHPCFQWIFRVTYNWISIADLVPRMRSHLGGSKSTDFRESKSSSSRASTIYDPETYTNFTLIFRERFCVAAASLAASMHTPLERLGVLYDKIVETGTLKTSENMKRSVTVSTKDMEAALRESIFGKGQVMFVVRQVNQEDADKLLNAGFRFASCAHISKSLAQYMQISHTMLENHLSGIKAYLENLQTVEKVGTWLALFAMIPRPNHKGFEIAVDKNCQDHLPDVQILPHRPEPWQIAILDMLDGYAVATCLTTLETYIQRCTGQAKSTEVRFADNLRRNIGKLFEKVPMDWSSTARFSSKQLTAHYSRTHSSQATTLYAFTVITDMHTSIRNTKPITRVPLSFFDVRQRCYPGSPDHAILSSDILHMFGPLLAKKAALEASRAHRSKASIGRLSGGPSGRRTPARGGAGSRQLGSRRSSNPENPYTSDDAGSSIYELIEKPATASPAQPNENPLMPHRSRRSSSKTRGAPEATNWGGILVSSETVIETDSGAEPALGQRTSSDRSLGIKVDISATKPEFTFVDQLVEIARERRGEVYSESRAPRMS